MTAARCLRRDVNNILAYQDDDFGTFALDFEDVRLQCACCGVYSVRKVLIRLSDLESRH